jgi:hypothetical protein
MRFSLLRLPTIIVAGLLVGACAPAASQTPLTSPSPPTASPSETPIDDIEHATGSTDVLLRFDNGPDLSVCDLCGELFQPGPEFTLYGDGTVIFRNDQARLPPAEGPISRAGPFRIAELDEDQVQSLLRFALEEGGLRGADERYEARDVDRVSSAVFTVHAGGLDKSVKVFGPSPLGPLGDHLRNFDRSGIPTTVWVPDRYWGNLLDASIFSSIGDGSLPNLPETGPVPWPWSDITPPEFAVVPLDDRWGRRRVMSAEEATVLSFSDNGGVVQRIYLFGPDGETIYYFSLWPMLPDDPTLAIRDSTPASTPAPTPPPLTSGPLRIDGLARVVVDRLRVRSAPGTGADSERLEPLLETGAMLFVIEGPVAGSGYDWYRIAPASFGNDGDHDEFRYRNKGPWWSEGPVGWVASADRNGTPWIVGARVECPDLAASNEDLSVVERLGPLVALSCYGHTSIQFRAKLSSPMFVDGFGEGAGPDPLYPDTYWATPQLVEEGASFGSVLDPARFPNGEGYIPQDVAVWNVAGHFDDEAATACGIFRKLDDQSAAAFILMCRTTFVVTDLVPTDAS